MTETVGTGLAVVFGTAFVVFFMIAKGAARRQRPGLPAIAKLLEGQIIASNSVRGAFGQVPMTYSFVVRGSGSSSVNWTEITAAIPEQYPLAIYLHPTGWFDSGKIERGEMTDVIIGEPAFDQKFVIEAAPAAVIRALFDERTRAFLTSIGSIELETVATPTGRAVKLAIQSWVEDMAFVQRVVAEHARFASRVREAFSAVSPEQVIVQGAPFREQLVASAARATDPHREEVDRVEHRRASRIASSKLFWSVIIGCFLLAWLGIVVSR